MVNFVTFKGVDGKAVHVNVETATYVAEGVRTAEGETSVIYFTERTAVRVNGRASKIVLKLAGDK